jgi:hypothetical protein
MSVERATMSDASAAPSTPSRVPMCYVCLQMFASEAEVADHVQACARQHGIERQRLVEALTKTPTTTSPQSVSAGRSPVNDESSTSNIPSPNEMTATLRAIMKGSDGPSECQAVVAPDPSTPAVEGQPSAPAPDATVTPTVSTQPLDAMMHPVPTPPTQQSPPELTTPRDLNDTVDFTPDDTPPETPPQGYRRRHSLTSGDTTEGPGSGLQSPSREALDLGGSLGAVRRRRKEEALHCSNSDTTDWLLKQMGELDELQLRNKREMLEATRRSLSADPVMRYSSAGEGASSPGRVRRATNLSFGEVTTSGAPSSVTSTTGDGPSKATARPSRATVSFALSPRRAAQQQQQQQTQPREPSTTSAGPSSPARRSAGSVGSVPGQWRRARSTSANELPCVPSSTEPSPSPAREFKRSQTHTNGDAAASPARGPSITRTRTGSAAGRAASTGEEKTTTPAGASSPNNNTASAAVAKRRVVRVTGTSAPVSLSTISAVLARRAATAVPTNRLPPTTKLSAATLAVSKGVAYERTASRPKNDAAATDAATGPRSTSAKPRTTTSARLAASPARRTIASTTAKPAESTAFMRAHSTPSAPTSPNAGPAPRPTSPPAVVTLPVRLSRLGARTSSGTHLTTNLPGQPQHATSSRPPAPSRHVDPASRFSAGSAPPPPPNLTRLREAQHGQQQGDASATATTATSKPAASMAARLAPPPALRLTRIVGAALGPTRTAAISAAASGASPPTKGAPRPPMLFCADCGERFLEKARFCAYCGRSRADAAPSSPTPKTASAASAHSSAAPSTPKTAAAAAANSSSAAVAAA